MTINLRAKLVLLILIIVTGFSVKESSKAAGNLAIDSGFEEDASEWSGSVQRVSDEAHSGNWSLKLDSAKSINSSFFAAEPHTRIEASAWVKILNVVPGEKDWHRARATLSAYKADQKTRIKHWDIVFSAGSSDWKLAQGSIITPNETAFVRLSFSVSHTTGTMWIDDVKAFIKQPRPVVDLAGLANPIIFPEPWQINTSGLKVPLSNLTIIQGDGSVDEINQKLSQLGGSWNDLGSEGYFVSVSGSQAWLGANTSQGLFYANETFNQLTRNGHVYEADIIDRPTLSRRGIVMGVQWFNREETYDRMAEAKMNFAWVQGSMVNRKLWFRWREALTESEKESIAKAIRMANEHYVELYFAIGPRGENASNPTYYSSEQAINTVVDKMSVMYDLGVRSFGLAYDDLANFGQDKLFGPDIDFFDNDLGKAHAYFANQVYSRLKAAHADINFMIMPMIYRRTGALGSVDDAYFHDFAQLPAEIEIYTSPEYNEDALGVQQVANRKPLVWDNFYATFYHGQGNDAPEYVVPLERQFNREQITGYTFLPIIQIQEDESKVSWGTAADYAWNPDSYDPERSFQRSAARYLGLADSTSPIPSTPTPTSTSIPTDPPAPTATLVPTAKPSPTATPKAIVPGEDSYEIFLPLVVFTESK